MALPNAFEPEEETLNPDEVLPPDDQVVDPNIPLDPELEDYAQVNAFLFRVPGYQGLKTTYIEKFRDRVRTQLDEFNALTSIPEEEKQRILPQIRHSIAQIEAYQAWRDLQIAIDDVNMLGWLILSAVLGLGGLVWLHIKHAPLVWWGALLVGLVIAAYVMVMMYYEKYVPIFFSIVAAGLIGAGWLQFNGSVALLNLARYPFWAGVAIDVALFMVFLAVITLHLVVVAFLDEQPTPIYLVVFLTASIIGLYWLYATPFKWMEPLLKDILLVAFGESTAMALLIYAFVLPSTLINKSVERRRIRLHPEDEITETLCFTLATVELNPDQWRAPKFRANIIFHLDWIEKRIQRDLYSTLAIDPAAREWLHTCTEEMAADLSQMAQDVILPKEDTRDNLIKKLAGKLVNAADRNWGKFERVKPETSLPWWSKTFNSMRSALFVMLPFLIIFAVEVLPFNLEDTVKNSIITAAVGLGVINLLSWLDPNYEKKTSGLKQIQDILKK